MSKRPPRPRLFGLRVLRCLRLLTPAFLERLLLLRLGLGRKASVGSHGTVVWETRPPGEQAPAPRPVSRRFRPLGARRRCEEQAGTGGAGLGWRPGSPGRAPGGLGEERWRAVLSLYGRWKWLRAFSRSTNYKGTLPVVPS